MKLINNFIFLGAIILLSLSSCKNQTSEFEWTKDKKEIAKKEISIVIDGIIENALKVNVQSAIKPYLNSPDFTIVNPDGTTDKYEDFKNKAIESFSQLKEYSQTTINQEYRFLNKDIVLYTWIGKAKMELKTGENMVFNSYVGTMLFKKLNNKWRIVYAQETASPVIMK